MARAVARQAPRRRGSLPGRARRPRAGRLAASTRSPGLRGGPPTGFPGRLAVGAVDGKAVRAAAGEDGLIPYLLAAAAHGTGTVLAEHLIGPKTNSCRHRHEFVLASTSRWAGHHAPESPPPPTRDLRPSNGNKSPTCRGRGGHSELIAVYNALPGEISGWEEALDHMDLSLEMLRYTTTGQCPYCHVVILSPEHMSKYREQLQGVARHFYEDLERQTAEFDKLDSVDDSQMSFLEKLRFLGKVGKAFMATWAHPILAPSGSPVIIGGEGTMECVTCHREWSIGLLWVPKTCATWSDASSRRWQLGPAPGTWLAGHGLAGRAMIVGLWASSWSS
jgi:hypothetical protein